MNVAKELDALIVRLEQELEATAKDADAPARHSRPRRSGGQGRRDSGSIHLLARIARRRSSGGIVSFCTEDASRIG